MTRLRLPYIKEYRDRHGKARRYFRRRGQKIIPLPGEPGSEVFMSAYAAALDAKPKKVDRFGAGTLGKLMADYFRSSEFSNLKDSSKTLYHFALDPIAAEHGHRMVREMPRDKARKIIETIGASKPGMANLVLSVLKRVMRFAIDNDWRADNPLSGIHPYKIGTHHTWTAAELEAYEAKWPLGTRERLAYALLLYTGQRTGDVVRMNRADIIDGAIRVKQQKTGAVVVLPIFPALMTAIKAGPADGLNLIGDQHGRPIKRPTLTKLITKAARDAGLQPRCVPHGLRKALLMRLAEDGATSKQIAAISGHRSLKEIERYTDAADQKTLARSAMDKLRDRTK